MSIYFDITVLVPAAPDIPLKETMVSQIGEINVVRYRYAPIRCMETLAYPGAIVPRIKEKPIRILLVPLMLFGLFRAIRTLLREENYFCVNAHWFIPQGAVQLFFKGKKHPPFVVSGHGGDVWSLNNYICNNLRKKQLLAASKITVVSEAMKDRLYSLLQPHESFGEDKIKVLPMGCDVDKFSPHNRSEVFFKETLDLDGIIILFVGRLADVKGVTYLIDAMADEALKNTNATLVIVGDGPLRKSLEEKVANLGLCDTVKLFGHASHEQLSTIYASADIFCSPSIIAKDGNREGFLVTNVEASASGLPVVTTKNTMSYVDNQTAYTVDDKDSKQLSNALCRLVSDKSERTRLGENGMQWAKQLAWNKVAKRYADVICEAGGEKRE